jgi:dTDP-4-amino-4,6-dideoxygalactose transaminase
MKSKIWLSAPHMGGTEQHYVNEAFDTNWVAPLGFNVDNFELDIAQFLDSDVQVTALSSGTAAIHLGLIMLGVQPGDEVICQSMTFSASANPIAYLGATPVFVDSEMGTWNMSPEYLEEAIKDRIRLGKTPKAIIPVHLYGMPARMGKIQEIASRYNIPVLEDAAEALGSAIDGRKCGTFGDMSVLSFNGNKIITTSGGGALVSKSKGFTDKARFLATQARDAAPHYQHSHIGYNYRMSNICAGIGRGQMEVLPLRVNQRRNIFEQYVEKYSQYPGICFVHEPAGYFSNRWLTTILVDPNLAGIDRETLRLALLTDDIESRPLWKPMHLQPVFKDCPFYGGEVSEKLFEQGLCLPSSSSLTGEDMERIFELMDSVLQQQLLPTNGY